MFINFPYKKTEHNFPSGIPLRGIVRLTPYPLEPEAPPFPPRLDGSNNDGSTGLGTPGTRFPMLDPSIVLCNVTAFPRNAVCGSYGVAKCSC